MQITLYKGLPSEIKLIFNKEYMTIRGKMNMSEHSIIIDLFKTYKIFTETIPSDLFSSNILPVREHFIYEIYKSLKYTTFIEEYNKIEKQLPAAYISRTFTTSVVISKSSIMDELKNNLNQLSEIIGKYLFIDSGNFTCNRYDFKDKEFKNIEDLLEDYKQELNRIK